MGSLFNAMSTTKTTAVLNYKTLIKLHVDHPSSSLCSSSSSSAIQCQLPLNRLGERLTCSASSNHLLYNEHLSICTSSNSGCYHFHKESWAEPNSTLSTGKGTIRRKFLVRSSTNGAVIADVNPVIYRGINANNRTALVWFKHDLRIDDHPGLVAASAYSEVLPLFVFDPELLAGWSIELVEALRDAVVDLQNSLQNIGSDLIIRFGRTQDVLHRIANEVEGLDIIAEEEVEMDWHELVGSVSTTLTEDAVIGKHTAVKQWRSSIYEIQGLEELPDCYKKFQELQFPLAAVLDPPASLPSLPGNFNKGYLPSLEDISKAISIEISRDENWEEFRAARETSAELLLGVKSQSEVNSSIGAVHNPSGGVFKDLFAWREKYILASPYQALEEKRKESELILEEHGGKGYVVKGGATGALNILQGYLRFLEPTGRDDWQKVHEHVLGLEERPGASFRALFGNALALGTLSLRRVYQEAMDYEKARGGGWLSPFGFSSFTGAAAIRDSKAIEWYRLLALKTREQGKEQGFQVGTWRWRGFLVQYAVSGETGPPVVFVHGFGAFWQHWRDNIKSVAGSGHRVFALTMLGFGRSEKPLITYTDLVWGELVRDFIVEVVGEPVIIAGNSIGGYTASVVAGLWPSLVKSLILLNSAGRVVPDYKLLKYKKPREKSSVAYVGARLLLAYLQNLSNGMLTKCYPTNPWRADSWLQDEVMRAVSFVHSLHTGLKSYDPNATAVLEAMFHLRAPLPLNYYLDRYNKDILVIQGMRDPLHNSSKRASMLQAFCKNVSIQYVNAGHCPHDEVPEDVNTILTTWLKERSSLPSSSPVEQDFGSGVPWKPNSEDEPGIRRSSEELNVVIPEVLVHLKEEVEELV